MHAMYLLHACHVFITCMPCIYYMILLHELHAFFTCITWIYYIHMYLIHLCMHYVKINCHLAPNVLHLLIPCQSHLLTFMKASQRVCFQLKILSGSINQRRLMKEHTKVSWFDHTGTREKRLEIGDVIKVKSSMTRSLPVENLPPIYTLSGRIVVVVVVGQTVWPISSNQLLAKQLLLAKQPVPSQLLFHSFTTFRERGKTGEDGVEAQVPL